MDSLTKLQLDEEAWFDPATTLTKRQDRRIKLVWLQHLRREKKRQPTGELVVSRPSPRRPPSTMTFGAQTLPDASLRPPDADSDVCFTKICVVLHENKVASSLGRR